MATAAGGIATPKNIVDYISTGSTILNIMASSTSTVANKCITYGTLSGSTVNAGIFNIAGTYTNEKCVKFSLNSALFCQKNSEYLLQKWKNYDRISPYITE